MGAVNSADIDNTKGVICIETKSKQSECKHKKLINKSIVKNGEIDVSIQYLNVNNPQERSYMGELSGNYCVKSLLVSEAQKLTMIVTYKLVDYIENNSQIKKYHGIGHIIFRSHEFCTSVQLCIDSLTIGSDGQAVATYIGYFERDVELFKEKINIDVCTTFMLTFTSPGGFGQRPQSHQN